MVRSKKGVELAMNTIVIAIIVVIVLIITVLLFTGILQGANLPGFVQCEDGIVGGYTCVPEDQAESYAMCHERAGCSENEVCCREQGS